MNERRFAITLAVSRRFIHWRIWAILLLLCLSIPVQAQSAVPSLQLDGVSDQHTPDLIVAVTLRDGSGNPIPDLPAEQFEILETGLNTPRPITGVISRLNPDTELAVVLVIDISGSMTGQPLANAKAAAISFLEQLGPNDQAALVAFADSIAQETLDPAREIGFTKDKAALITLINNLEAGGGTPLYDALYKAVRLANEASLGQRSILLLTDGRDEGANPNQPGSQWASQETPIQEAKDADTPIFTIGLGTQTDAGYLERVARTTGGVYQQAPDSTALAETFQNVIERLKQQYLVTYRSGFDCDGQEHRVEVGVKVNGRSASDSALFTMPLNPGCNISAIITATPTSTPTASVTPTTEPTKTSTPTATATTTVALTVTPQPPDDQSRIPFWLIGGLGIVLVGGGGLFLFARRRNPEQYCQTCGYRLGVNDASCPKCGSAQTFVDGKR